ncbi:tripartite tricarboxylate transporter substrate binding protein [Nitrincola sp.]|uniref:tripartite tricarboxylate transporter substrate binding protein n=1 Tax=Nitrincola sp. TaxID=1926584 RepID=UPI003A8E7C56
MKILKLACLIQLLLFSVALSAEESFPARPLTLLIGFEQGGSMSTQGSVLAEVLSEQLGQPVNIQYRPGIGGGAAAAMLATSHEQGYMLLFTPSMPFTNYPLEMRASYDLNDFAYIGAFSKDQQALVTRQSSPFSNWSEFLEYARQEGEITFASQTLTDRRIMNHIARQEGFIARIIPVTGGSAMATLVMAGDVDIGFSGGSHSKFVDAGNMQLLAGLGNSRLKHYATVPTLKELGYDLQMSSVRMLVVPATTPPSQQQILISALHNAISDPRFIYVTEEIIHQPVRYMSAESLTQFLQQQQAYYLRLTELEP